jgi:DnaA family protein
MKVNNKQLTLGFGWGEGISFANYASAGNAAAVHALELAVASEGEQCVYCWGGVGTGKSHLLQAACQATAEAGHTVAYLPLAELLEMIPGIFDGLEQLAVVCIDDVQMLAGHGKWETALFHLYNRMRDAGSTLLVTGSVSPAALALELPDLRSRLSWGPVFQLQALDDDGKIEALRQRAASRGFDLPDGVARFLIRRIPRDMASLFALLDRLDEASLSQHRRLTIPFVRKMLG